MDDGGIKTSVYRKATHTDQYLNGLSHHPLEHKRSVVWSLMNRADNIISTDEDTTMEKEHIRKVLEVNNFDPWMMTIPRKKTGIATSTNTTGGIKNIIDQLPSHITEDSLKNYRGFSRLMVSLYTISRGIP